ncbi:MAG: P-loop NTPase fold protein, partial [Candidatus Paceibacterota bacterium]
MDINDFKFIKDEPIHPGSPGYFDFYHKSFSPALKEMILSESCPHTIGLFSKWGTGKSSIIDQLDQDLQDEEKAKVFVFDAWKYQEDSLRRTFLIKLKDFLEEKGYEVPEDILSYFYKGKSNSVTTTKELPTEDTSGFWSKYKLPIIFLIVPFVLGVVFYVLAEFHPTNKYITGTKDFLGYLNSLAWLGLLAGIFLKPIVEKALEKITSKIFESTASYTEVRTQVENEERLNSPEQFENVFKELVRCVDKGKLVIVFDNIDRVQGDIALKILSTIKTFLDVEKSKVIFVVPCDAGAIHQQIKGFYREQNDSNFDESEYLKKLFNVVINTPEFIDADLKSYTKSLLDATGEDMKAIISNDQVLSVITKGFKNNPREVKQFINNLVSAVLVASKSEVADVVLSPENIAYFTKVTILKQKYPEAYKKLKENWSQPEKIVDEGKNTELRSFLTLTSTVTTEDAEPFVYLKSPQITTKLQNPLELRKVLIDGNVEEFEDLVDKESDRTNLVQYILAIQRYQYSTIFCFTIFKTQTRGFVHKEEGAITDQSYLDETVSALELIWDRYLNLPMSEIFTVALKMHQSKSSEIYDRYISVLSSEEIKQDSNKAFLSNLLDELKKVYASLNKKQREEIVESIRENLSERIDVLSKFTTTEDQDRFIHPDILRNLLQEQVTNKNLAQYTQTIGLYKDYAIKHEVADVLAERLPELTSAQNAISPSTTEEKVAFYKNINEIFSNFQKPVKELPTELQKSLLTNLDNAYTQARTDDALQPVAVTSLRWLQILSTDQQIQARTTELINSFIAQSSQATIETSINYWNENGRNNFVRAHIESAKKKVVQNPNLFNTFYKNANDEYKHTLVQHIIAHRPDHGLDFLQTLNDKIPNRASVMEALLQKASSLPPAQRVQVHDFTKGKIAINDPVNLKQTAVKQIYDYLKSEDVSLAQYGANLLDEPFLSDSDLR